MKHLKNADIPVNKRPQWKESLAGIKRADRTEPTFTAPKPSRCRHDEPVLTHNEVVTVWLVSAALATGIVYGVVYAACAAFRFVAGLFA